MTKVSACPIRLCLLLIFAFCSFAISAQRIAVLSDIHVSPGNENAAHLSSAVAEINASDYSLVVINGDLTNEGSDAELLFVKSILDQIKHPTKIIPGNHENNWSQSATKTFVDLWGNDRFSTNVGPYFAVGINCGPYMKMGDGHVKQEDLHWLSATLDSVSATFPAEALAEGAAGIISFNHYPIRINDLDNYRTYNELLRRYPVLLHINGHYHRWDSYSAGGIPAVTVRALTVDDSHGYSVIDICAPRISVYEKLLGEEPALKYSFEIDAVPASASTSTPAEPQPVAVDVENFSVRKMHTDEASIFTQLAVDSAHVYFGTSTGEAKAVSRASGEVAWALPLGASLFASPAVLSDSVVAFPHPSGLCLVNTADGALHRQIQSPAAPYVADGMVTACGVYLQGGYKHFEARDAASGDLLWCMDSIANYCQGRPAVDGTDVIFGAWDTYLRCVDIHSGREKWRWSNGRAGNLLSPANVVPAVTDSTVVIVAPDRFMTSIHRDSGATLWRSNAHRFRESMGLSADGKVVYAKTMDGELVAVDAHAPVYTELWMTDMGIGYDHAPCPILEQDGVIYVGSRRGIVTALSADGRNQLWQLSLGESEINGFTPDPVDGSVWVSLIEGSIFNIKPL